jgi:hypothetical protein
VGGLYLSDDWVAHLRRGCYWSCVWLQKSLLRSIYDESGMKGKPSGAAELTSIPGGVRQSYSVRRE